LPGSRQYADLRRFFALTCTIIRLPSTLNRETIKKISVNSRLPWRKIIDAIKN
jgi:hypothetical protein